MVDLSYQGEGINEGSLLTGKNIRYFLKGYTTQPREIEMSKVRAGIRGAGREELKRALEERLDFATSGALRGGWASYAGPGRLNPTEWEKFRGDLDKHGKLFIVRSYETPIAWAAEGEEAYHVGQTFTTTTSRHQGSVRVFF